MNIPDIPDTETRVLLLSLYGYTDDHIDDLLTGRCHVECAKDLDTAINSIMNDRPHIIVVTDPAVTFAENQTLIFKLYEYVKGGGTLILGSRFSTWANFTEMDKFFGALGLNWKAENFYRSTVQARYGSVKNPESVLHYLTFQVSGVHLKSVDHQAMLYIALKQDSPELNMKYNVTPFAWKKLGEGFVGYISDVLNDPKTDDVMLAMCGLSDPGVMSE
ncbi:uncharacterized protein K452DRAFT_312283 [Aplosporella prunicola CBS 121167]|uniref:Uncharacterized protein n=1 Tax=Aplosporella prunicola CBS 121167 TaxID=1176127 RepID=A0A6A6B0B0_9PEZI|nr:uncharacterized protein K452DRAFT_312283 [Aplosporella prunicola CBS 121167]KAF2137460.1 hypothetical protein K452DRAFT_312283 [Aplosporella prunicola CBS 121167]